MHDEKQISLLKKKIRKEEKKHEKFKKVTAKLKSEFGSESSSSLSSVNVQQKTNKLMSIASSSNSEPYQGVQKEIVLIDTKV